jgi:hypothetical protein
MFHMLSWFNLKPGISADEFCESVALFTTHLTDGGLICSAGPIGRRQSETILDTDEERQQEYFFSISFRDRAQSDRAVEHIFRHEEPTEAIHTAVYSKVTDEIFICWEDL